MCNIEKELSDEFFYKKSSDFYQECKACISLKNKKYYIENKEKVKTYKQNYYENNKTNILAGSHIYYTNNKTVVLEKAKQYYKENSFKIKEKTKKYREENLEYCSAYNAEYYQNNKSDIAKQRKAYVKNKRENNAFYKLRVNVSRLINIALHRVGASKNGSITTFLPSSIEDLKKHLESLFEPWMNWNNWGKYDPKTWDDNDQSTWKWQMDHIIPQSKLPYFSMEDENFKKCWALSNLRPLSAKQNVLEGNRR